MKEDIYFSRLQDIGKSAPTCVCPTLFLEKTIINYKFNMSLRLSCKLQTASYPYSYKLGKRQKFVSYNLLT